MNFMVIEPNVVCQLRCPECARTTTAFSRDGKTLSIEALENALQTQYYNAVNFFNMGEPLLYKNFRYALMRMREEKFYILISTNAQNLAEQSRALVDASVDKVWISLDGLTQETYEKYRVGGKLQNVLDGVRELNKRKKESNSPFPRVALQFLLFEHNIHEMGQVQEFAQKYDFDQVQFKLTGGVLASKQYSRETINQIRLKTNHFTPVQEQAIRPVKDILAYHGLAHPKDMSLSSTCLCLMPVIHCDGSVTICCRDYTGREEFDSVSDKAFDKVVESERYKKFLQSVVNLQGRPDCEKKDTCNARPVYLPK